MRLADWKPRLTAYLVACARKPFEEGAHDCALFAAGGVEAVTGIDPAAGFRGQYTTTRAGLQLLRRAGFADHIALAESVFVEVHASFATPGDLAVVAAEEGPALGLMQGEAIYLLSPSGIGLAALARAVRFLKVG